MQNSFAYDNEIIITPQFIMENYNDETIRNLYFELSKYKVESNVKRQVNLYLKLGELYCNRVNFHKAYEAYWEALFLLDEENFPELKAQAFNGMGVLYSLFNRNKQAVYYYQKSLDIIKSLVDQSILDPSRLRKNYYSLAVHYRYQNELEKSKNYLDSCTALPTDNRYSEVLIKSEKIYHSTDFIEEDFLKLEKELLDLNYTSYLVIFYTIHGDSYLKNKEVTKAKEKYLSALDIAKKEKAHLNFTPIIYEKLSHAFQSEGDLKNTLKFTMIGNQLNNWLYSSKSDHNKSLLEISDDYKKKEQQQLQLIKQQEFENIKQEQKILLLTIAVLVLITLGIYSIVRNRIKTLKLNYAHEKANLEYQQKIKEEKNNEVLTIKNSELTNTTLQIIAKDELLIDVKSKLKTVYKDTKSKEIQRVMNAIKINQDQSWLEFENRFTSVNPHFYKVLKDKYPTLTNYDLKICALIKLNFTGKEMAKLLGISPESANTSRYRLRKRLGLEKGEDLLDFIHHTI